MEDGLLGSHPRRRDEIHTFGRQRRLYGTTHLNHGSHQLRSQRRVSVPEVHDMISRYHQGMTGSRGAEGKERQPITSLAHYLRRLFAPGDPAELAIIVEGPSCGHHYFPAAFAAASIQSPMWW